MNNENNDNIIENFIFNNILKSDNINNKILNLYDKINDEKIWNSDKFKIIKSIIGHWITNDDNEVKNLISKLRNKDINSPTLYKLIFEVIEKILNINDSQSLNIILSSKNESIIHELKLLIINLISIYEDKLHKWLRSNRSLSEFLSIDYLSNQELEKIISHLDNLNNEILKDETWIIKEYNDKINNTIKLELDKIEKIKNISAFPKN